MLVGCGALRAAARRGALGGTVRELAKRSKARSRSKPKPKAGGGGGGGADMVTLEHVSKSFGERVVLHDVSARLLAGSKVGVLGANGAGKSTLLRLIGGLDAEHDGAVRLRPGLRVGMLEQEPALDDGRRVLDNVLDGVSEQRAALDAWDQTNEKISAAAAPSGGAASAGGDGDELEQLLQRQAELTETIERFDCWNLTSEANVRAYPLLILLLTRPRTHSRDARARCVGPAKVRATLTARRIRWR